MSLDLKLIDLRFQTSVNVKELMRIKIDTVDSRVKEVTTRSSKY